LVVQEWNSEEKDERNEKNNEGWLEKRKEREPGNSGLQEEKQKKEVLKYLAEEREDGKRDKEKVLSPWGRNRKMRGTLEKGVKEKIRECLRFSSIGSE